MSLYRCSACGSPHVVTDSQNEGFSYLKGAIGTAILGPGGAVAGINGKKATVFKCPDCGLTMNEPMGYEIQMLIDAGVRNYNARAHLTLRGMPVEWEVLKNQYKNIESGLADQQEFSLSQQIGYDYSSSEGKKYLDEIRDLVEYFTTEEINSERIKKQEKEKERVSKLAKLKEEEKSLADKKSILAEEYKKENTKYSSLGFFKFSEKKAISKHLEEITSEHDEIEKRLVKIADDIKLYEKVSIGFEKPVYTPIFSDNSPSVEKQLENAHNRFCDNIEMARYRALAILKVTNRKLTSEQIAIIISYYWGPDCSPSAGIIEGRIRSYLLDGILTKQTYGATRYYAVKY